MEKKIIYNKRSISYAYQISWSNLEKIVYKIIQIDLANILQTESSFSYRQFKRC